MKTSLIVAMAATGLLTACGNVDSSHLIFGQKHNVGISISASVPQQTGGMSVGYTDENIAIVPVATKRPDGGYDLSRAETGTSGGGSIKDAFSTLGTFNLDTEQSAAAASIGLGKFFATGAAAQILADGFKERMKKLPAN